MNIFSLKSNIALIVFLLILNGEHGIFAQKTENKSSSYSSSYLKLKTKPKEKVLANDSVTRVKWLIDQSDINRYSGNYDIAFDHLWEAQILAEQKNYKEYLVEIYRDIGILYDIYNKDSLAISYLQKALRVSKKNAVTSSYIKDQMVSNYFSIATFLRDRKEYQKALIYLDSCYTVHQNSQELPYVLTDQAYCNLQLGKLSKAEKQLKHSRIILEENNAPYTAVNLYFTGDLKKEKYQYDSALFYYQRSLEIIENSKVHTELKSDLQQKIAELNIIKGDLYEAITNLKASKTSNDKLFGATSKHNQRLFEIKNKYKTKLEENKAIISKQESVIKQKNKDLSNLLSLFGITLLIAIGIYVLFYQRNKFKRLTLINNHEIEKNKAVLEVKNKELTSYALKMVKMEEAVHFLDATLKIKSPKQHKEYLNQYSQINNDAWHEFNQRFTEVNTQFYEVLCQKYPDLTSTELKHCALIKLNFNSHEMSKILNISLRSVHTSRYRIRKKLGLTSNSSLTSHIGSL
ncbi:hypothetical protein BZG02_16285 [Labilibaculum filiforme]|uniref:HTH luxR-type domain-containing protein n=1 Tax=Labilibaculum filiforme TaxID=1940526 RepID=A0A2N3HTG7_9BACT|nr:hypothetical protein [Labilibaculum filiforme]PKQ61348.1 hypothetical protein BZG02_16285 [Labilibaculum filiforme]